MLKRVLIGILIFLVWLALVIGLAFALHFEGMRFALFCIILGLVGAAAIFFTMWYLHKMKGGDDAGANSAEGANLNAMLRDADTKVRSAHREGVKSLAAMPLVYIVGDENSAKTQTVLQSGLEPELLAGNVYQDGMVVPTRLANLWLTSKAVLVEAGGPLLREPGLFNRLLKATIPARLGSAFSRDSRLPARAVVVCVSIERILAPNTSEQIRALAQTLNERLRQVSQTLGISLPVYVLFTKLDNVGPFAEYVGNLSDQEVKLPIGSLLSAIDTGTGLYLEQATASIGAKFDQLMYGLSEFRLEVLSRSTELPQLARAYEFPRDLRKLRAGIVSFLAEIARPSQIGVNPFLRGFYFTGMRAHIIEDILDVGPAQAAAPAAGGIAGATRIFSMGGAAQAQAQATPVRRRGTRKVPQWVFLPHLFSEIVLGDKSALETSRASTRTSYLKRTILGTVCALLVILLVFATISFFRNRELIERVATAAATPVTPVAAGSYASLADLQTLDKLRSAVDELDHYRADGPPWLDRMGLYRGNALYPVACRAYANKFRTLLLGPTQQNMRTKLNAVPATAKPDDDYSATYRPLKAYILTASNPDPDTAQDTVAFLPAVLSSEWQGAGTPEASTASLAQAQFAFYANHLAAPNSCLAGAGGTADNDVVAHARAYLNGFQGFQHVYQSMLAAANRKVPGFTYNSKFPGSAQYIVDTYPIQGAFTKDGFTFMQDAILHPDPYYRGEEWVLGPPSGPPPDRTALIGQLKQQYTSDFVQTWRNYLAKAQFQPYRNFADAGMKLSALDSNTSPMLALFSLASTNTAVADPAISNLFLAPQAVVPPNSDSRLIAPSNQPYIAGLQGLEGEVKKLTLSLTGASDPNAAAGVNQAVVMAEQAAENLRNGFVPDTAGGTDRTTFSLLKAPIDAAQNLAAQAPLAAAGGGAKSFCAQAGPVLAKFPFNPQSTSEATPEEVAQIFAPGQGSFWAFYNASIKPLVQQQGTDFAPAPGSQLHVSRTFLNFLGQGAKISSALFPAGGNQPSLSFTLAEVKSPGTSDAVLAIDNQQITAAGQSTSFHWVSEPGGKASVTAQGNSEGFQGPWSVFHLGFAAMHTGNRLRFNLQLNGQTNGVALFDISGPGAPLLNPDFMRSFHCVTSLTP